MYDCMLVDCLRFLIVFVFIHGYRMATLHCISQHSVVMLRSFGAFFLMVLISHPLIRSVLLKQ